MTDRIFEILKDCGAVAVGVAPALPAEETDEAAFDQWIAEEKYAGMEYMRNWREIRLDPRLLLDGAATVISMAFPYPASDGAIASYALSDDYHDVLRAILKEGVERIRAEFGGEYRICIDSAPILERYWAEKCGVGVRGRNGLISVEGYGTRIFLAEIVTTLSLSDDSHPVGRKRFALCPDGCSRCRMACPAGALPEDGTVDARRCLSYLTIEHRGDWDTDGEEAMQTPAGRHTLFGCDLCQRACPLNKGIECRDTLFPTRPEIASLTPEEILAMNEEEFRIRCRKSPLKRAKLPNLQRNAANMLKNRQ